jgi:4'-phosphopantetheinyl transferase
MDLNRLHASPVVEHAPDSHACLLNRLSNEVHVWFADPAAVTDHRQLAACTSFLSSEETERHRRFRFEKDRHQFLVSHALVRKVLSSYVDVFPSTWRFSSNRYGRPEISVPDIDTPLRFNLSHTDGLAACVVTLAADCGVDVERLRMPGNPPGIAEKMFAATERNDLDKLQGRAFQERFFTYWTLREAYCKSIGLGLSQSMDCFSFERGTDDQFTIRFDASSGNNSRCWQFTILRPTREHIAAVATRSDALTGKRVAQQFLSDWGRH